MAQTSDVRDITFPVLDVPGVYYNNDFGDSRGGGTRSHEGIDIVGEQMTPLVAAVDGTIRRVNYPEASWGYAVILRGNDGYRYWYLHMNNDTPGTDDGQGGALNAYAPYMDRGFEVKEGQLIGWMGDSGNAETTVNHLHFEIHSPEGGVINPYETLQNARKIKTPVSPPEQDNELLPFKDFDGGASIAVGDFGISNSKEFVAGAGPGGAPHVRLMDLNKKPIGTFYAYDQNFNGGVNVATGDLNGDGKDEIITAPGPGGGPHVKMFNPNGTPYTTEGFFAYTPAFTGGINIATADVDGDGKDEIITGAGPGGGPHVKIFRGDGTVYSEGFFAFDAGFSGGIDVAGVNKEGSSEARIIVAAGPGGGPHVKIFNAEGNEEGDFYAYDEGFQGGVKISTSTDVSSSSSSSNNNDNWWYDSYGRRTTSDSSSSSSSSSARILTAPALDGGPDFRVYDLNGENLDKDEAFEEWWQGGYDIAAGEGIVLVSSTDARLSYAEKRRTSIWEIF
ncbi:MAG: peptidoglycan DD-metalloendopeptidase family protein [Candidatus Spechtbacterales bacterium]|nr:peptidoglycan DD-metalloendopeptidase family protein [Candidatus Spechtbacterales bacterium]